METPLIENLENPIMDEYDREEMENLEIVAATQPEFENANPRYLWDHPDFEDLAAWETNEPADEYMGGYFGMGNRSNSSLEVGTRFDSKDEAKYEVQKWHILHRVEYVVEKSTTTLMVLSCRKGRDECPWGLRIAALRGETKWEIRTHRAIHTCQTDRVMHTNVHLTKKYVAKEIHSIMHEKLRFTGPQIQAKILNDYGLHISPLKAWQAKQQAMENLWGTWDESFKTLPYLMAHIMSRSPGTIVRWDADEIDGEYVQVNRIFWAFGECIHAFRHCRPVISIDGTHMYGKYDAKLLVACALDANNHVLPIAFALVESENNSSWSWFMRCIREGVTDQEGLCVISDRHGGIMSAMREPDWSPPKAYHRICVRHFVSNFNTKVKDTFFKKKLTHVAYAKKEHKFKSEYEDLLRLLNGKPDAQMWLRNVDPGLWALAKDEWGMRWGSMTTNASESFNAVLKHGRDLPISALVKFTYIQLSRYFDSRRYRYQNTDSLFAPKVHERLEVLRQRAQYQRVEPYNRQQGLYQVTTPIKHNLWTVSLSNRTCSCGKWTTFHIPCSHAIAV